MRDGIVIGDNAQLSLGLAAMVVIACNLPSSENVTNNSRPQKYYYSEVD